MLKQLTIKNIILVEYAEIPFGKGLNVLSGETGSGKSAVLGALSLIAGDRADTEMVRRGADKGIVEAAFEINYDAQIQEALNEGGIDHSPLEDLLIRREVHLNGKNRIFINNQQVQLTLLKKISSVLIHIAGQYANQKLSSLDYHRESLDLFGGLTEKAKFFAKSWEEETLLQKNINALMNSEAERLRGMEVCRMEIEEIQDANIKEGEEEEVFAEYTRQTNSEELARHADILLNLLAGEKNGVLPNLLKGKNCLDQLSKLDAALNPAMQAFQNCLIEIQEIYHSVRNYHAGIEHDPEKIAILNERLILINKLKRKYGKSIPEVQAYLQMSIQKLNRLEKSDEEIDQYRTKLQEIQTANQQLAQELTHKRKLAAAELAKSIESQLKFLNMPKAKFHVVINEQKRNWAGDDKVEFFITPNLGEKCISLRDCASGGELSRVMLALQTLLSGKENKNTMVFDEIDANIGGETAVVVGQKLKEMGQSHQVLCVTHFPQVARCAHHHIQIAKKEVEGRTITVIQVLDEEKRKCELDRMQGGREAKATRY